MTWLRFCLAALSLTLAVAPARAAAPNPIDAIARDYVQLALELGERDDGYVDAYYGPAEWRAAAHASPRTLEQLAAAVDALAARLGNGPDPRGNIQTPEQYRPAFLRGQIRAMRARIRQLRGERLSFTEEAREIYGVALELKPLAEFDPVIARIDALLPGDGALAGRVDAFMDRFVIRPDRLDAVMRAAIAECRRRTLEHIPLPAGEAFTLEFVTGRSWSGYNWYQGNYRSLIQVNTDQPVRLGRAIDLGCHEGYPGHHVYNMLLERDLARGRGWVEYMVYPLYSPQSLIAEGSANYGIDLAFPGAERLAFETRVLYPLAGVPAADAARYLELQEALKQLSAARFTIARDLLERRINREEAIRLTQRYSLMSRPRAEQSVAFTEQYRAYVINYGLGEQIVKRAIEAWGPRQAARWRGMHQLLSWPFQPADLVAMGAQRHR